jgi:hypothetical protein
MRLTVAVLTVAIVLCGCNRVSTETSALTPDQEQSIRAEVRQMMQATAHDVTQEGPIAWQKHFESTPSFFMAVNGALAFTDGQAANRGIQDVARTFKKIDLQWGDDVRVDPLTTKLAGVATTYHESITLADGGQMESKGFFTALAENQGGQWQFRNVHWSVPAPMPTPTPAKTQGAAVPPR